MVFSPMDEAGPQQHSGLELILKLAATQQIVLSVSDDAAALSDDLGQYDAVIFLGSFAAGLSPQQQLNFQAYIQSGGGFMGIQAELADPGAWPWYTGMYRHAAGKNNFQKVSQKEARPAGGVVNQEFAGGRVSLIGMSLEQVYTQQPDFENHFLSGLQFVLGPDVTLKSGGQAAAGSGQRFHRRVLQKELNEGLKLAIAGNGTVYYIERAGRIYKVGETQGSSTLVGVVPVSTVCGNGLLGIALDPEFARNNQVYLYYTPEKTSSLCQRVSRFRLKADGLDLASEQVLLTIPYDYREDGHTGGALLFDEQGNLFISTGDNTNPHESNGFGPTDDRPGRTIFDAQRTSGNTASLLGKILRIRPQPDGTYTIPEGNLFSGGNDKYRPEIYVMGCRNPYSLSFDSRTGFLYWGDVGPDAGRDSTRGSRGYDEINQARRAGFFGWPYFTGENKAYADYDFATGKIGAFFDPAAPVNHSANNTGSRLLPPAQPAFIAYPYTRSDKFPQMGEGTRCAIAGPVYHFDPDLPSAIKFPAEYDNVLFIADWSRKWLMTVHLDAHGNYSRAEPFMALAAFDRPIDLKFGPDGALYLLEYGEPWGMFKTYGTLVRIEHATGNRPPLAVATASDTVGPTPLTIKFSHQGSGDPDKDAVKMEWSLGGKPMENKEDGPDFTFRRPGQYLAMLTVTDAHGRSSQDWITIRAGNARPAVQVATTANQTFYWENTPFAYQVKVQDQEDGLIDSTRVQVTLDYLPEGKDVAGLFIGRQDLARRKSGPGSVLMEKSDCKTCHSLNKPLMGPSLQQIAHRYSRDEATVHRLASKVIAGGGGVWGSFSMSAHPQLSQKQAAAMVRYILSLNQPASGSDRLPVQGQLLLNRPAGKGQQGLYIFTASYTDKGSKKVGPLSAVHQIRLRSPQLEAADFDKFKGVSQVAAGQGTYLVSPNRSGGYMSLQEVDLRYVDHLSFNLAPGNAKGFIEVRQGSPAGPVLSHLDFLPAPGARVSRTLRAPIKDPGGKNELFFVFGGDWNQMKTAPQLHWVSFDRKQQLANKTKPSPRTHF